MICRLRMLDDRMLADIGLKRDEIDCAFHRSSHQT
jgi:uncharacterized protein YjiS (DUF1127 family)